MAEFTSQDFENLALNEEHENIEALADPAGFKCPKQSNKEFIDTSQQKT